MKNSQNYASSVENVYQSSSKTGKQTTLIKEATSESSNEVTLAVSSVIDHTKATTNSSIDFSLKTLKTEMSLSKCQTSLDGCLVVVKKKDKCEAKTELMGNKSTTIQQQQ